MADSGVSQSWPAVSPYLIVEDAWEEVRFLKEVFGARELMMMGKEGEVIRHAEFGVCGVKVMVSTVHPPWKTMQCSTHVYVSDVDAVYAKAMGAGAESLYGPADMFYGDRSCGVKDKAGNVWWIATKKEEVGVEEIKRRVGGK